MPIITPPRIWLYRCGMSVVDSAHRRYVTGQTWLTTDAEDVFHPTQGIYSLFNKAIRFPFGLATAPYQLRGLDFVDELWPRRRSLLNINTSPLGGTPILNPSAPEAAFRLRRVGAGTPPAAIGRLALPIQSDSFFTDVPHRRHVDLATLAPLVASSATALDNTITYGSRTYHNVIFRWRDFTWVNVSHFELLVNPIRVWHRRRTYDPADHLHTDGTFVPNEEW